MNGMYIVSIILGLLHTEFGNIVDKIFNCRHPSSEFCGRVCAALPGRQLKRVAPETLATVWRVFRAKSRHQGTAAL